MKGFAKKSLRKLFELGQRLGLNILPKHFYSQIPDIAVLRQEQYWRGPNTMVGVLGAEVAPQLAFAADCCPASLSQALEGLAVHRTALQLNNVGQGYGPIESDMLYAFICRHQPARVIQIGCGVSTAIILRAARDSGYKVEVVCVEPYPSDYLRKAHEAGEITLLPEKAQKVDVNRLTDLPPGGLFFVDSTHTVAVGSEVNRIILEVLPRLAPDRFIHFHDIFFPYDYTRNVLGGDLFFWCETTLLHAYLVNNPHVEIKAAMSMLHYEHPEELRKLFPAYQPQGNKDGLSDGGGLHFPSSVFLKTL